MRSEQRRKWIKPLPWSVFRGRKIKLSRDKEKVNHTPKDTKHSPWKIDPAAVNRDEDVNAYFREWKYPLFMPLAEGGSPYSRFCRRNRNPWVQLGRRFKCTNLLSQKQESLFCSLLHVIFIKSTPDGGEDGEEVHSHQFDIDVNKLPSLPSAFVGWHKGNSNFPWRKITPDIAWQCGSLSFYIWISPGWIFHIRRRFHGILEALSDVVSNCGGVIYPAEDSLS